MDRQNKSQQGAADKNVAEGLCTSVRPVCILCTKQERQGKVIIR